MVFFSDGLLGAEFNFYGPRPSRLGYYLNKVAGLKEFPVFDPLLRSDVAAQLERSAIFACSPLRCTRPMPRF